MTRTPLAWANLTHDRMRFALFVLGIVFAVVLMFAQLGFRSALLDSQTRFHERVQADLILIAPTRKALAMPESFSRRRLPQAAAVPGVRAVHPLWIDNGQGQIRHTAVNPNERATSRGIRMIGIEPDSGVLAFPELAPGSPTTRLLKLPGMAVFDRATVGFPDQTTFGPYVPGVQTAINSQSVTLIDTVPFGPDFTTDGALVVSSETFADILRRPYSFGPPLAEVDLAAIQLESNASIVEVQQNLQKSLSRGSLRADVDVLTKPEWIAREHDFWLSNTPIGFAFGFGVLMGIVVGLVICYQILSGDVSDHLAEYATLKAVGHSNRSLAWVVIQQSLILAVAGYAVGLLVSVGVYQGLGSLTGLPLRLTWERCVDLFGLTVLMCVGSSLLALIPLVRTDPADVF